MARFFVWQRPSLGFTAPRALTHRLLLAAAMVASWAGLERRRPACDRAGEC